MWYKIDFTKLAVLLLPPVLRSRFLTALLGVIIAPLRYTYRLFCAQKATVASRLNTTGNVLYLEKALNDAFYLRDCQIFIETPEEEGVPSFYFSSESQSPNCMFLLSEEIGFVLLHKGESRVKVNFIVKVPTFLCTSVESKEGDRYQWRYLATITKIINIYKPAGRTFSIELYDYE